MPHSVDAFIGQRIRDERLKAGLTQVELAKEIGIRFQQLQKYETAANRVSGSRLWMICKALGIPISALFPTPEDFPREPKIRASSNDIRLIHAIVCLDPETKRAVADLIHSLEGKPASSGSRLPASQELRRPTLHSIIRASDRPRRPRHRDVVGDERLSNWQSS